MSGGTSWLSRLRKNGAQRASASDWAIEAEGARLSHADLAGYAEQAAARLESFQLKRGEIVAILAAPSLAGVCVLHGFLETGIVMLPLNSRLAEGELREALISTGVKALLVLDDASTQGYASIAEEIGCSLLVLAPELDSEKGVMLRRASLSSAKPGSLHAPPPPDEHSDARREGLASQGAALILRTSGTTGQPKGAVLSLDNLLASAEASQALLETSARDRWLLCMPLFHIGGLSILVRSVLDASTVVLHPNFDAARVSKALATGGITCVSFVATMLQRLLVERGEAVAPPSLRIVLLGGGPATQALLVRAVSRGYPLAPTYGLTEAASQVATRPPGHPSPDPDDLAAGLEPLPGVEIRIADEGPPSEAPAREGSDGLEGEIEVRGANVMLGYLDAPEATAEVLRGGWLRTGDFGRLDRDGRLRVLDRRSDLILSGGENIYPAEIESVLEDHAAVEEAAVVGRPDAEFGSRPMAFVVLQGASARDAESSSEREAAIKAELRAHCEARLARFKVPVATEFRKVLPRTASGKLKRRELLPS